MIDIGCGLVGIGREWGVRRRGVPSREDALAFLRTAVDFGIRLFDTAPAYGLSEERLGAFLAGLDAETCGRLIIATKCGEEFDPTRGTFVDHSPAALQRSIERSLRRLGTISILQLHKATRNVLEDDSVLAVLEEARKNGITKIGASVSTVADAIAAIDCSLFDVLQFPYNLRYDAFAPVFAAAAARGTTVLVNRPLAEGAIFEGERLPNVLECAFSFILEQDFTGYILVGSKTPRHFIDDVRAFRAVAQRRGAAC